MGIKSTKKTIKRVDDRTGSMTGAPSPKERAMMDKMPKAMPKMPNIKIMPMNTKVSNSTPMMKKKKK